MPAPVLGLQALLQALGTISVGGAVGYKAQKSLKDANIDVKDFEEPELRMLRALLMPTQAIGTQIKEDLINKKIKDKKEPKEQQSFDLVTKPMPKRPEDLISKSAPGLTGEGITLGPKAEDIEKVQEEIKQVTKPPITSTPIKPITTETFPAEPQQKPEPPVQPEIDVETKESFPEIKTMPIIYSMEGDKPKFKYPTEEEIKEYINEENKFWKKNIQQINEKNPKFSVENMPKVVEADKHFGAAAYTFQNYNDSKLIYMSPDEYLSLTKKYRPEEDKEQLGSKMNVKNLENILREGGELANIPTLFIKKPFENMDTFEVVGQEGNHRAKAFKNLGYDKIPVVIEGYTRDDRKKTKDVFPTSITSDDDEMLLTKPTDFYDVITKEKLVKEEQPQAPATEKLFNFIKNNPDGFTVGLDGETIPSSGFVVAESKLTEIAVPTKDLTREQVTQFAKNLKKLSDSTEKEIMAGGWYNDDDGKYYLDGPVVYDTLDEALYAGEAGEQIGVFDLNEGKVVDTKEGIKKLKEAGSYNSEAADVFRRNREKLDQRIREIGLQDKGQSEE